jgi:3-phosphoshikimate 1-carboxyvinyltransferase
LSGLNAGGKTCIVEKGGTTRNHTELLLQAMCADIKQKDRKIMLQPSVLKSTDIRIVGDISSASYWLVLACIKPNCQITVQNVGLNPTRIGILNVFKKIGVDFTVDNVRMDCEIFGDITVRYKPHLKPFEIDSEMIPTLIDELPILSLLACFCEGKSSITGAEELRVKESDRISNIVQNLKAINADIKEDADGMTIHHSQLIGNVSLCARQDHRIAMTMEIASAVLGGIDVRDNACIAVSYPNFLDELKKINREML